MYLGVLRFELKTLLLLLYKNIHFCISLPVRWTDQSALHFTPSPSLADMFIPKPTRLLSVFIGCNHTLVIT